MRPDVHALALRSAAKLVLGMASLATVTTACSSETTDETGASTDAVMTKNDDAKATNDNAVVIDNGLGGTGAQTTAECKEVLASAYPHPGGYQWEPVAEPADVVACCNQELVAHGAGSHYRWDCCVAYDPNATPSTDATDTKPSFRDSIGWACTPWGPPVPPSFDRVNKKTRKMSPARRDMNRFLASQLLPQVA